MKKITAWLFLNFILLTAGELRLLDARNLRIHFNGMEVISSERCNALGENGYGGAPHFMEEEIGGARVYNAYGEMGSFRFRREIAVKNGEIEVSVQTVASPYSENIPEEGIGYGILLPWKSLQGASFVAVVGRARATSEIRGVFEDDRIDELLKNKIQVLFISFKEGNVAIDCNPRGINCRGDYGPNHVVGLWNVSRRGDFLELAIPYTPKLYGGDNVGKVVIYEGTSASYDIRHSHRKYPYFSPLLPERNYSFGKIPCGKEYTQAGNQVFQPEAAFGWNHSKQFSFKTFGERGALYAGVFGQGANFFRMSSLRNGLYLLTVACSAGEKPIGPFRLTCNGKTIAEELTVEANTVKTITFSAWVEEGAAEIGFEGNAWCVSTIGAQLLQTCHEDYTFRRGFWASSQAPSPSVILRNEHYAEEPHYAVKIDTIPRHPWGQEMASPLKTFTFPSCHAEFDSPEEDWRYEGDVTSIGAGNQGYLGEISDEASARRIIEELKQTNAKVLMCNGMLSRHTFPSQLQRVKKALQEFSSMAHDNGMLIMDHIDCTLLWNMDSGFRVLTEDMPLLQMTLDTHLPARGYCIGNQAFINRFLDKVEEYVVDCKLDGIMIDELCYHDSMFCGCEHCRRLFFEETGWRLPLDETSEHLYNRDSILWRKWNAWRQKRVGDIWFDLKTRMKRHNKRFVGMGYTTHTGLTTTYGTLNHGVALEQLARGWDYIGTEIMPRNVFAVYRGVAAFRRLKNYFHHSMGLPVFGEVYTSGDNWNVLYFGWALNSLNGQSSWGINASASVRKEGDADFMRFTEKEGRMNLRLAKTQSKVATYFSPICRDWPQFCSYIDGLLGGIQMMNDMHLEVDVLTNVNFNAERLSKYDVLLLENTLCISDEEIAVALAFAKAGGTLVLTHRTGMKDGNCIVRKEWPFKELFKGLEPTMGKNRQYSLFEFDGKNYECEAPVLGVAVRKPKGNLIMRGKARLDEKAAEEVVLYEIQYGKGRVLYTPFVFGHSVWNDEQMVGTVFKSERRPVCESLFQAVIRDYAGNANAWEPGNTPAGVLTGVFDVAGKSVIHFLNATGSKIKKGDIVPPNPPEDVFPMLNEDIRFAIFKQNATKAYAVSPDFPDPRPLQFEIKDGRVNVILPKGLLKAYTIVYVE